jgi:hypothetical protein
MPIAWAKPTFAMHKSHLSRRLRATAAGNPPQQALTELRRRWPEYVKGIPALRLADQIDDEAILRARAVEAELAGFLADIGYTDGA